MILSIVTPAFEIPEGTKVRKPSGEKVYTLQKHLKLFSDPENNVPKEIHLADNLVFLIGDSISVITDTTKLAVDFNSYGDAIAYLESQIAS